MFLFRVVSVFQCGLERKGIQSQVALFQSISAIMRLVNNYNSARNVDHFGPHGEVQSVRVLWKNLRQKASSAALCEESSREALDIPILDVH